MALGIVLPRAWHAIDFEDSTRGGSTFTSTTQSSARLKTTLFAPTWRGGVSGADLRPVLRVFPQRRANRLFGSVCWHENKQLHVDNAARPFGASPCSFGFVGCLENKNRFIQFISFNTNLL